MLLFFAIGCAHYEVMVSSINNNETAGNKVFVAPGMKDVAINDLQFQEFSNYIKKVLIKKGFAIVNTIDEADQVVMLVYAISGPQNYTANVPLWGPTGIESSTTYGNISSSGSYYGNTYYNQTYGITGVAQVKRTFYSRTIILIAFDWKLFKTKKVEKQLWKTDIVSIGSSNDLRYVFPYMVVAAEQYIGTNTRHAVTVKINEYDRRVKEYIGYDDK